MNPILEILNGQQGNELINGASQQLGLSKTDTMAALSSAMPIILGAMKNNASSSDGALKLLGALGNSKHSSGGLLDNLGGILGGSGIDEDVLQDGGRILGHIFGGQENNAVDAISKSSGINGNSAAKLMQIAAPFIMSYLAKTSSNKNISDEGGLMDLLGGMLGNNSGALQDMASKLQGFDSNDSTIDDIAAMISGNTKSTGGIGDLLGKFF